ncbi:putative mitochondrial atpase [Diplodia seriata]|uniref:Putative mitochondrial atpase n=1 Tax=Diplodia seriata TaxID=420778 RepID=A0A0G2GBM0_9PEZI|nr:putative mitochondrial atpase [Diplodia seriata]
MLVRKYSTGVAITNPLVLYRALLATSRIRPDPSQHRLALHLQKLYERLKDYEPATEYSHRLHQISRVVGTNGRAKTSGEEIQDVHPRGFWSSLLAQKEKRDSMALTRVLTSHEQAMQLDSPKGLMLHGEVGTGKSMLIDLFADCLPNRKKRRWHFNTFMLDTLSKLETLRLLKARCEVWEMEGGKDYRRSESEAELHEAERDLETAVQAAVATDGTSTAQPSSGSQTKDSVPKMASMPKNYFVKPSTEKSTSEHEEWLLKLKEAESTASGVTSTDIPWSPSTMRVYGRQVTVPRQHNGVASWTFSELCASQLGPADYITLASTFHTLILTDVPVLTLLQKNEARRFITLLDALYEARCKLLITAAGGPDDIFFPESRVAPSASSSSSTSSSSQQEQQQQQQQDSDAVYSETFSDIYQDATAPFRPNISSYDPSSPQPAHREELEPEPPIPPPMTLGVADHDDNMLAPDALEDDPPNRVRRGTSTGSFGLDRDYYSSGGTRAAAAAANGWRRRGGGASSSLNFAQTTAFTGEDERFAYKRARSRLWEMCGARWWARDCPARSWWTPVAPEVRARWEVPVAERVAAERRERQEKEAAAAAVAAEQEGMGAASEIHEERDEVLFRHGGASPFRTHPGPPPKIGWTHVWGTMTWGKKAGAWGKGVEGLEERRREKEELVEKEDIEKEGQK